MPLYYIEIFRRDNFKIFQVNDKYEQFNVSLTSDQQNSQQEIGEESGEVNDFAGPTHSFPDAEVAHNPDK